MENTVSILFQAPLWGTQGRCCRGRESPSSMTGNTIPPVMFTPNGNHPTLPGRHNDPDSRGPNACKAPTLPTGPGKTRPFHSQKPEHFASPGRKLDLFLPCYEVISESHLFPSRGCLTTPRVAIAANSRRGGSGAATAVNPEPWAGERGASDAKPHL